MYRATDLPQYSEPQVSRARSPNQFGVTRTIRPVEWLGFLGLGQLERCPPSVTTL